MTDHPNYRPRDWNTQPPLIYPPYKSTALRGLTKPLVPIGQTLSERTGPIYGHDDVAPGDNDLTKNGARIGGGRIGHETGSPSSGV